MKILIDKETVGMALEALENPWESGPNNVANAITALRQAIAEAEQAQPVAWILIDQWKSGKSWPDDCLSALPLDGWTPLYAQPQEAAPLKPLTDDEIAEITVGFYGSAIHHDDYAFARAIEAAHGITGEKE